ncbi:hypothetical protein DMA11_20190 [Marinilabiliaceae bacterium JC017]|nr:hypothetical protein DMA11_20190 [Marinilabiliaceae bacterium JC017]
MKIVPLILFLSLPLLSVAQPNRGWKGGMNVNWINNDSKNMQYSPGIGYHFGYAWRIKCSPKVSISIESLFNRKSVELKYYLIYPWNTKETYQKPWQHKRYDAFYISAPIGVNYTINNQFYISGGYEFGYCLDELFGDCYSNQYDHAGYLGGGFHTRYFDFIIRYARSLYSSSSSTVSYYNPQEEANDMKTIRTPKNNTLQFSIILSLGNKNKKE